MLVFLDHLQQGPVLEPILVVIVRILHDQRPITVQVVPLAAVERSSKAFVPLQFQVRRLVCGTVCQLFTKVTPELAVAGLYVFGVLAACPDPARPPIACWKP